MQTKPQKTFNTNDKNWKIKFIDYLVDWVFNSPFTKPIYPCEVEEEIKPDCERCGDSHYIEIEGDGDNFEGDVVATKPCPDCNEED